MSTFPLVNQLDSMQCGVACLAMICKHYGKEYSLDTLSLYCHCTSEGVSPDFIFLDEATNALDAKNERTYYNLVKNQLELGG